MERLGNIARAVVTASLCLGIALALAGCTRSFYRKSTDREVNDILAEKDVIPECKIEQMHVYPDSRARFADTTNPDHPPMPPDDEAAWKLSPHPQKPTHHGGVAQVWGTGFLEMIKAWDAENRAVREEAVKRDKLERPSGENKNLLQAYIDEGLHGTQAPFLLGMDQMIELGVVNSPQYQSFREQLYLAALPVTQQRFNFAYQWAATADWIRQWAGSQTRNGQQNNWTGSSTLGFSKLFATGALLTTDFANTTAFNFAGNGFTSTSAINVNLAQPLLQGGGKAVTLEPLTQAERNLFYNIRAYARFRKQFNVTIALGSSLPTSLNAAAGGAVTGPISTLAALGLASTDVAGGSVGYLPSLYRQCDLAADRKLAHDLQETMKIIEAYQEGGFYSPLQVDQIRAQLLQAQNTVLSDQQFVANNLDQFKILLGLPTNMPLVLDDAPARPITRQLDNYYELIDQSGAANRKIERFEKQELLSAKDLRSAITEILSDGKKSPLVRGTQFAIDFPKSWGIWRDLKGGVFQDTVEVFTKQRRSLLKRKTDLEIEKKSLSSDDEAKLLRANFEIDLAALEKELRNYEPEPWTKLPKAKVGDKRDPAREKQIELARLVLHKAKAMLVYARNERFEAVMKNWPEVLPAPLDGLDLIAENVEKAQEVAVRAALAQRLDLQNARAQVVDAWRQLKVTANALMGVATVSYDLQAQTAPTGVRPLVFVPERVNQQIRLNFQLPLNRVAERNAYRTALIRYQAARRTVMTLEDSVAAQVRFDVRQLQLFVQNYHIQKKLVHSLYKQVDSALDVIIAPTDPDALKGSGTSVQANAAALTNQYLGALTGLNNAQVRMFGVWLSIDATRMQLYLDLERLPLDLRGVWVDEHLPRPAMLPDMMGRDSSPRDVIRRVSRGGAGFQRPVFLLPIASENSRQR